MVLTRDISAKVCDGLYSEHHFCYAYRFWGRTQEMLKNVKSCHPASYFSVLNKKGYIPRAKNAGCKNQTQTIWQEKMIPEACTNIRVRQNQPRSYRFFSAQPPKHVARDATAAATRRATHYSTRRPQKIAGVPEKKEKKERERGKGRSTLAMISARRAARASWSGETREGCESNNSTIPTLLPTMMPQ